MTGAVLRRADAAGVATLRLARPESRNALNTDLLRRLSDELDAVADDPGVRALILCGKGAVFCAGADLKEFRGAAGQRGALRRIRLVSQVVGRLRNLEQPTVCAVSGAACGAGWGLALACDLTYAAADATFSLPELPAGLRLPPAILHRLAEVVGPVRAAEIAYSGDAYTADQALAWGWVGRVLPDSASAERRAREVAGALARAPGTPTVHAKQVLRPRAGGLLTPPPEYTWNEEPSQ
ncbi:enoyl-CoA hydratase paaG [Mycobacterium tuberculosis]|nr:enoyl-CoA hydratase paaG [Mycobacterium tuberculosis]